jgi:hypothetical protein
VKPKCSSPVLLSWARTLLQSASSSWPPLCHLALSDSVGQNDSSHEVSRPYSVSPLTAAASCDRPGLPHPTDLRPQVFSTSRRFSIRREPAGLISCRIRSWGLTLQSFAPATWLYAVSGAPPLMTLVPARRHLVRLRRSLPPEGFVEPPSRPIRAGHRSDLPSRVHPFPQSRSSVEAGRAARSSEAEASLARTTRLTPLRPKPQRSQTLRPSPRGRNLDETDRHPLPSRTEVPYVRARHCFGSPKTPSALATNAFSRPKSRSGVGERSPHSGAEAPFGEDVLPAPAQPEGFCWLGHLPAPP